MIWTAFESPDLLSCFDWLMRFGALHLTVFLIVALFLSHTYISSEFVEMTPQQCYLV